MTRIDNALNGIQERLEDEKSKLDVLHKQMDDVKAELAKPFARENELNEKSARLNQLNILLNLDKHENENDFANDVDDDSLEKSERAERADEPNHFVEQERKPNFRGDGEEKEPDEQLEEEIETKNSINDRFIVVPVGRDVKSKSDNDMGR